jgi:hypothetical protein
MKRRSVAIVDNEPAVRDAMRFLIELHGRHAMAYASAVAFLADDAIFPACMIVDHHMPDMNGLELVDHLVTTDRVFPILLMSGALSPAIIDRAAALGIASVIAKPPDPDMILDFVAANP